MKVLNRLSNHSKVVKKLGPVLLLGFRIYQPDIYLSILLREPLFFQDQKLLQASRYI